MPEKTNETPSQPPPEAEKTMFFGGCNGVVHIPASEYENYLKGFREAGYWVAAVIVPLVILALILFF